MRKTGKCIREGKYTCLTGQRGKSLWCITTTSWYEVWTSHSLIHKGSPHIDIADSNNSPSSHNSKWIYVSSQS